MTKANFSKKVQKVINKEFKNITFDSEGINFRKVKNEDAYTIYFRATNVDNKLLEEVWFEGTNSHFINTLKKHFNKVVLKGGAANFGCSTILGN